MKPLIYKISIYEDENITFDDFYDEQIMVRKQYNVSQDKHEQSLDVIFDYTLGEQGIFTNHKRGMYWINLQYAYDNIRNLYDDFFKYKPKQKHLLKCKGK